MLFRIELERERKLNERTIHRKKQTNEQPSVEFDKGKK